MLIAYSSTCYINVVRFDIVMMIINDVVIQNWFNKKSSYLSALKIEIGHSLEIFIV